jgi:hypothetical protein
VLVFYQQVVQRLAQQHRLANALFLRQLGEPFQLRLGEVRRLGDHALIHCQDELVATGHFGAVERAVGFTEELVLVASINWVGRHAACDGDLGIDFHLSVCELVQRFDRRAYPFHHQKGLLPFCIFKYAGEFIASVTGKLSAHADNLTGCFRYRGRDRVASKLAVRLVGLKKMVYVKECQG